MVTALWSVSPRLSQQILSINISSSIGTTIMKMRWSLYGKLWQHHHIEMDFTYIMKHCYCNKSKILDNPISRIQWFMYHHKYEQHVPVAWSTISFDTILDIFYINPNQPKIGIDLFFNFAKNQASLATLPSRLWPNFPEMLKFETSQDLTFHNQAFNKMTAISQITISNEICWRRFFFAFWFKITWAIVDPVHWCISTSPGASLINMD